MPDSIVQTDTKKNYTTPLIIIGILFFIFGLVTWVNSVLIAFFQKVFELNQTQSYLVTFAFFISYTIMAIPCSFILKKIGFKNGISLGLATMACGTLIFVPAANASSYMLFLVGLFVIGAGLTILQTAANPYVTIIGPRKSAAQRISFMGLMNKVAGIVALLISGEIFLGSTGQKGLGGVIIPYIILTVILLVLAMWIRYSHFPEVSEEQDKSDGIFAEKNNIFQYPNLVLGVIALFCYVGVEVVAVDTIILYGKSLGFIEDQAKLFGIITLFAMVLGYFIGMVLIPKFISQQRFLKISAIVGIVFTIMALLTNGFNSVLFVGLLGLANAIMWPALWPLGINGLGKYTKLGSAFMIMGISGGAIVPLIFGSISDSMTQHYAYIVTIPCYAFILFYAMIGYKMKSW